MYICNPKLYNTETATISSSESFNMILIWFQLITVEQNFGTTISVCLVSSTNMQKNSLRSCIAVALSTIKGIASGDSLASSQSIWHGYFHVSYWWPAQSNEVKASQCFVNSDSLIWRQQAHCFYSKKYLGLCASGLLHERYLDYLGHLILQAIFLLKPWSSMTRLLW